MTAQQKRTLTFTVTASLLGLVAWAVLTGAARQIVLRNEMDMHIQIDAQRYGELRGIVLDLLCADHPANRRCEP